MLSLVAVQSTSGLELCIEAGVTALWKVPAEGRGFRVLVRSEHSENVSCNFCSFHQWIGIRHGRRCFGNDGRRCGCQS